MTSLQNKDKLDELVTFHKELKMYQRHLNSKKEPSEPQLRYRESLREKLVRKTGELKQIIVKLTGKQYVTQWGQVSDIWNEGLVQYPSIPLHTISLSYCIDATNEAIGKLKSDIEKAYREKQGNIRAGAESPEGYEEGGKNQEVQKPKPFKGEIRKQLNGTPEELVPHIIRVAQEFQFQGSNYHAQEERYKSSQFSKQFRIMCGGYFGPQVIILGDEETTKDLPHDIGIITIQSLPNNKALLIGKHVSSNFDIEGSYFNSFLERLSAELKSLGFKETIPQKVWRWIKEIKERTPGA